MACLSRVVAFLMLTTAHQLMVGADYELRIGVHSYKNARHRNAQGSCCDVGCTSCDNYFVFCLLSSLGTEVCDLGEVHTGEVGGDYLSFSPGEGSMIGSQPNPLQFPNSGRLPSAEYLAIHIYNKEDSFPGSFRGDNYVDTIGYLQVSSSPSAPRTFFGTHGRSAMRLSFQALCAQNYYGDDCGTPCASSICEVRICINNYYGPDCTTFCEERDDEQGHYTCDSEGARVCLENYYGLNCTVFCEERDDEQGHYTCDSEGNIVCRDGYTDTSTNCTECIPADGCSTVGGYCVLPNQCLCYTGFTGRFCENVLDVCAQLNMCYNRGTCVDDGIGGYQCICQDGYTTPNCDTDGQCANSSCQNLGECVDRVNGFVCFCVGGLCIETDFEEEDTRTDTAENLSDGNGSSRAGVIGGIVAGSVVILLLVGLIIIVVVLLLCRRWRKQSRPNEALTERLMGQTEPESNPGVNPTYIPTAVGTHVLPEANLTGSLESTLRDFPNPLYRESGDNDSDTMEQQNSVDSSVHKVYNPLYRTSQRDRNTPAVYSTYSKVGDRHSEGMYDTIDHNFVLQRPRDPSVDTLEYRHSEDLYDTVEHRERVVTLQAHSPGSSTTGGSGVYEYVSTGQNHYNTEYVQMPCQEDNAKT